MIIKFTSFDFDDVQPNPYAIPAHIPTGKKLEKEFALPTIPQHGNYPNIGAYILDGGVFLYVRDVIFNAAEEEIYAVVHHFLHDTEKLIAAGWNSVENDWCVGGAQFYKK